MVVLLVVDPNGASVLDDRTVLRHAVRNACEEFRQVERRVGVMTNPKKKDLAIQIVHTTDRALGDVGRKRKWVGCDPGSFRSGRRKGVEVIASQYTGQSPERIRDDSEARRCWSCEWVEGGVVIPRRRGHHQSAVGPEGVAESLDQAERSSLDRSCDPEGCVYEQDTVFRNSERTELIGYLGYAQFVSCRLALEHARPRVLRTSAISFAVMRALDSGVHCGASVRTAVDPRVEPAGENERMRESGSGMGENTHGLTHPHADGGR